MKNSIQKTAKFLCIIMLTTCVFSCSKEDEKPPMLIGKWFYDKQIQYVAGVPGAETDVTFFNFPGCNKGYIEFKDNINYNTGVYNQANCNFSLTDGKYVFDGKNFIMTQIPYSNFLFEITTLTTTDLVVNVRPPNNVNNNNDIFFTFKFKRSQ